LSSLTPFYAVALSQLKAKNMPDVLQQKSKMLPCVVLSNNGIFDSLSLEGKDAWAEFIRIVTDSYRE